jgi:hypothetical protein
MFSAMWRPCSTRLARRRTRNSSLTCSEGAISSYAHSQFAARIATSMLVIQLMPWPAGLRSIQSLIALTASAAYASSPVALYAIPSVGSCWNRDSSHGIFRSARPAACGTRLWKGRSLQRWSFTWSSCHG